MLQFILLQHLFHFIAHETTPAAFELQFDELCFHQAELFRISEFKKLIKIAICQALITVLLYMDLMFDIWIDWV